MLSSAATQAELKLTGSGSLKDYLVDLNKNNAQFIKDSKAQKKNFEELNKVGSKTEDMFKSLALNSKTFFERVSKFTRTGRDTVRFFKDTGSATISLQEGLESSSKGFRGLALASVGLRDETKGLSKALEPTAEHLIDIADAGSNTERAFVILSKVSSPLTAGLNKLSDGAEKFGQSLKNSELFVANFAKTIVGVGAKSLQFFAQTFSNIAENLRNSGLFGKIFASNFDAVSKSLDTASESAEKFSTTIDPEDFGVIDKATEKLGKGFENVGKTIGKVATGVSLANFVGGLLQTKEAAVDFSETVKEDAAAAVQGFAQAAGPATMAAKLFFTKLQIATTASQVLGAVLKNELLTGIGAVLNKFNNVSMVIPAMVGVVKATSDAVLQAKGLSDNFTIMQNLGIDTSAAAMAFQFGLVGEKLLFSSQAAKEFGMIASQAFLQLQDAAAFVTTIGTGAAIQLEGMDAGIESISASLQNLVSGPLKNTLTSTEAAGALYNALSAGIGVATDGTLALGETNQFLAASLKLSSSTGADAAQTLELLAKTSKVYGLSNSQAATTASKLYQIVEDGIVQFPQLTQQLGETLSVAQSMNVGLEEAGGAVAALTKISSADSALVGYRSLLQAIAGQGAEAQKAVSELGIQFDVNSIKTKGLNESLKDLYNATGGNVGVLKEIIPDSLAFRTALNLMTTAGDDAATTMNKMKKAGDESLDELFEKRQQSVIKQYTSLMNGFNEVMVDLGSRTLPALKPGIDFLEGLLGMLQSMPDWMKNAIGVLILFQTGIVNIGGAILGFAASMGQLIAMFVAFNVFQKLLSGQLPKLVSAIKNLNSAGFDLGGTLALLVGYNKNLNPEIAEATAQMRLQAKALKDLNKQGVNFEGDIRSVQGLENALEATRLKIETLQNSRITKGERGLIDFSEDIQNAEQIQAAIEIVDQKITNLGDAKARGEHVFDAELRDLDELRDKLKALENNPLNLDKTEAELKKLEKSLASLIDIKKSQRVGIFEGFKKKVAEGVNGIALTIQDKQKELEYVLRDYFATFGEEGQSVKQKFEGVFREILADTQITVEEKAQKISESLESIIQDSPDNIKQDLDRLKNFLVQGVSDIENETTTGLLKLQTEWQVRLKNLVSSASLNDSFSTLSDVISKGFKTIKGAGALAGQEMASVFENILSDSEMTVQEKINAINTRFSEIAKSAPESVKGELEKLKNVTINGLSDIKTVVDSTATKAGSGIADIAGAAVQSKVGQGIKEVGQKIITGTSDLSDVIIAESSKINKELAVIGGPPVPSKLESNFDLLKNKAAEGTSKVAKAVEAGSNKIEKGFDKVGRASNSAGNLLSNFFPQIGFAQVVLQDAGDLLEDLGFKIGNFAKATKTANTAQKASIATSKALVVVESQKVAATTAATTAVSSQGASAGIAAIANTFLAKASTAASAGLAKVAAASGIAAKGTAMIAGGATAAAGGIGAMAGAVWALMAPLLPFIAAAAAIAAALALMVKLLAAVIPGLDRMISANARSAKSAEILTEKLKESNAELEKMSLQASEDRELKLDTTSARRELELTKKSQEELMAEMIVPEKEFLQGFRGVYASINEFFLSLDPFKLFPKLAANSAAAVLDVFQNMIPEGFLKKKANDLSHLIRKTLRQAEIDEREAINERRRKQQERISSKVAKQLNEIKKVNVDAEEMMIGALEAYEVGNAATIQGNKLLQNALAEGRSMTSDEYIKFRESEEEYFEEMKKKNAERIEQLTKLQEAEKNPRLKEELQLQIDKFAELGSEIEQASQKAVQFRENIQALLSNVEANQSADGVNELNKSLTNLYTNLSPEAQERFAARFEGLTVSVDTESIVDKSAEAGEQFGQAYVEGAAAYKEKVEETMGEVKREAEEVSETGATMLSSNVGESLTNSLGILTETTITSVEANFEKMGLGFKSAAERMRSNAALSTGAALDQLITDINDPERLVTNDDITTALSNNLDAIGEAYVDEGERLKAIIATVNQEVVVGGKTSKLRELLKPKDYEAVAEQITGAISAQSERLVVENGQALEKLKAQRDAGLIDTKEALEQEILLQEDSDAKILKSKQDSLKALEESNMGDSRVAEDLRAEIARLEIENDNKVFANKVKLIEAENDLRVDANQRQLKIVQAQVSARVLSEQEGIKEVSRLEEEASQLAIDEKRKTVQAFIDVGRGQTEEGKKAAAELLAMELELDAQRLNNRKTLLESELNLLKQQKENEFELTEQNFQKELNLFSLREKAMKMEADAMSANKELSQSIRSVEEAAVQARLKFTGDIVERAKIEQQMAVSRQKALVEEQKFEVANLEMQQALNKMALEREAIGLRLNKLELEKNLILAEQRLSRAEELKLTEEEKTALELQVSGLKQQIQLNGDQQGQLAKQVVTQDEINKKQRTTLNLRQQAAQIQSASEVELANAQVVLAQYEKQKQQIQNNARIQELQGNERLEQLRKEEELLNNQTAILQKQYDQVKQTADLSQRMYSLAQQSATTGFQQARIQKEAAIERRKNLENIQKIERMNLEINQFLKVLALNRKEIELDIAEIKQQASVAEAVAEQAKVNADPNASQEQKDAAAINTQAQAMILETFQAQRDSLQQERELLDFSSRMERRMQDQNFRAERTEADAAVAQTTRNRADDRRVSREARGMAREFNEDTQGFMQDFMQGFANLRQQMPGVNNPTQISSRLGAPVNQAVQGMVGVGASQGTGILNGLNRNPVTPPTSVNGNISVTLEIKGEGASKLNSADLQKAASDALYKGLDELFEYSIRKQNA